MPTSTIEDRANCREGCYQKLILVGNNHSGASLIKARGRQELACNPRRSCPSHLCERSQYSPINTIESDLPNLLQRCCPSPAQPIPYRAVALQQLLCHGVAQLHLPVQRVLLVVGHQLHQALEVGRGPQHEVPPLLLDSEVFHLPIRSAEQGHSWERSSGL